MDLTSKKMAEEINGTGIFLESRVHNFLSAQEGFRSTREYAYSTESRINDRIPVIVEGTADVLAATKVNSNSSLCLSIECKRAKEDQKHWVFEKRVTGSEIYKFVYYDNDQRGKGINFDLNLNLPSLGYGGMEHFDQAIKVFEFNESTGKISRDNSAVTYKALKQANEPIKALAPVPEEIFSFLGSNETNILFIPIVVTTANLWMLDYTAEDISWDSGTVQIDKLNLQPKGWVHYEFPLPVTLKMLGKGKTQVKSPTFVVNAKSFPEFIGKLITDCKDYLPH